MAFQFLRKVRDSIKARLTKWKVSSLRKKQFKLKKDERQLVHHGAELRNGLADLDKLISLLDIKKEDQRTLERDAVIRELSSGEKRVEFQSERAKRIIDSIGKPEKLEWMVKIITLRREMRSLERRIEKYAMDKRFARIENLNAIQRLRGKKEYLGR